MSEESNTPSEIQVDEENKNVLKVHCTKCPSLMLKSGAATLHKDKKFFMHYSRKRLDDNTPGEGEELDSFWYVPDMYQFENIGFSRPVDGKYKYLTCADCEQDVVGIKFEEGEHAEGMYVATSRVAYK